MAEPNGEVEPNVEQKARDMGWLPKDQFRGRPETWVEADKYVARGEEFIPFLQADRRQLKGELDQTRSEVTELKGALKTATETIEALKEFRTEINKERVEVVRAELVEGIKEARGAGDVEKEEALREKLADAKKALEEPPVPPSPAVQSPPPAQDITKLPEWPTIIAENPWWNTDEVMKAASIAIGRQLATEGKLTNLTQAERLATIFKATRDRFAAAEPISRNSRVEGGRGGGGGVRPADDNAQSFEALSTEVRAAADRFESRLVGKGKAYADIGAYHKAYAAEYFRKYPNG